MGRDQLGGAGELHLDLDQGEAGSLGIDIPYSKSKVSFLSIKNGPLSAQSNSVDNH